MNHSSQATSQFASIVAGRLQRENDRMRAAIKSVFADLSDYEEILDGLFKNPDGSYSSPEDHQRMADLRARIDELLAAVKPA